MIRQRPPARPALMEAGGKPLYEAVSDIICRRVLDTSYRLGTALPSEYQLAAELGVSQGTVRKALNDLVARRILFRRQGLGTFVSEHSDERPLCVFFNVVRDDGTRMLPKSRLLSFGEFTATAKEQGKLKLLAGAKVYRVKRLRFFEEQPIIIEQISLPTALFPALPRDLPDYLYRLYQVEYGIMVSKTLEEVKAIAASPRQATLLGLRPGDPLLSVGGVALTIERQPVEWRLSLCNSAHFHFVCERG